MEMQMFHIKAFSVLYKFHFIFYEITFAVCQNRMIGN